MARNRRVAPLVGAWIEMLPNGTHELIKIVAPLVGAWIEIKTTSVLNTLVFVAPLVGAWIEITWRRTLAHYRTRRSSCRSVD